jgi:deoxyribonuclease-4
MLVGSHVSIAGGLHKAFDMAQEIGCTAVQIFTKNANRWYAKPLAQPQIAQFAAAWKASDVVAIAAHDAYLINLASPKPDLQKRSQQALCVELERCEQLRIPYLVIHPGSHVGTGEAAGLQRVIDSLDLIHARTSGYACRILLETTAGQGSALGYQFEHLARIRERVHTPERLGVCLDTCHIFAAGYDLRTAAGYQTTMAAFDRIIGLQHLNVIHVNDSAKDLGSRVDRHEGIGRGRIGLAGFRQLVQDARLASVPKILETPKGKDVVASDRENLRILRELGG